MSQLPLLFPKLRVETQKYRGKRRIKQKYPERVVKSHSAKLLTNILEVFDNNELRNAQCIKAGLQAKEGIYLGINGEPGYSLKIESLHSDSGNYQLLNVRNITHDYGKKICATIYISKEKEKKFIQRIQEYANETTPSGKPKNNDLVSGISSITLAALQDFWTDAIEDIPIDSPQWCEIWLKTKDVNDAQNVMQRFRVVTKNLKIQCKHDIFLSFPERIVTLAKVNSLSFALLLDVNSDIAECRRAREASVFFTEQTRLEQKRWSDALSSNVHYAENPMASVAILDTGVNNGHPLLQKVLHDEDMHTVDSAWGTHDADGHGTGMAGIATYGDLSEALASVPPVNVLHCLESCKIMSGNFQAGDPQLYGFLTANAITQIQDTAPDRKRVVCMAVTDNSPLAETGEPTSWSAALDDLAAGVGGDSRQLILVSVGNIEDPAAYRKYPDSNFQATVENPAQSWNSLSVGAFTEFVKTAYGEPVAPQGSLSPMSRTSVTWDNKWPTKPDVVFEGGNIARDPSGFCGTAEDLIPLTTSRDVPNRLFTTMSATSAATAQAAWFAAQLRTTYPNAWPETIRALIIHSATWTEAMLQAFAPDGSKEQMAYLRRICGYGVPSLEKACWCMHNRLVLVMEQEFQPYGRDGMQMHIFELPWPVEALKDLGEAEVTFSFTLSYYIESNPGKRGWKNKFRYASHGLRFVVCGPQETLKDFRQRISRTSQEDEEAAVQLRSSYSGRWTIGVKGRSNGSVHSDSWKGTAADMATCRYMAIYPVVGWWRERKPLHRNTSIARYSLIVSLQTEAKDVDLYTPVAQRIAASQVIPDLATVMNNR